MSDSTIAQNRRARHDYEFLAKFEAGIALTGSEIKSVREHRVQLQGAYARIKDGEVWLQDANIAQYASAGYAGHQPDRDRKLLLHKKEIRKIEELMEGKGLTLIPLAMYFKRGKAKIEIGVGRGLHNYDKRQKLKEQDQKLDMQRALRRG
jgi:SsrA-binding protein